MQHLRGLSDLWYGGGFWGLVFSAIERICINCLRLIFIILLVNFTENL